MSGMSTLLGIPLQGKNQELPLKDNPFGAKLELFPSASRGEPRRLCGL